TRTKGTLPWYHLGSACRPRLLGCNGPPAPAYSIRPANSQVTFGVGDCGGFQPGPPVSISLSHLLFLFDVVQIIDWPNYSIGHGLLRAWNDQSLSDQNNV